MASSMNPAKRARVQEDIRCTQREALNNLCSLFDESVFSLVSDGSTRQGAAPSSFRAEELLKEADAALAKFYSNFNKSLEKMGRHDMISVNVSALPQLCIKLLKLHPRSVKADQAPAGAFKQLMGQLNELHEWAFKVLLEASESFGAESMLMEMVELKDILAHFIEKDFYLCLPFLKWIWKCSLLLDVRKALGRQVASKLVSCLAAPKETLQSRDLVFAELSGLILADTPGSSLPISLSHSLFESVTEALLGSADIKQADGSLDSYQSLLVQAMTAASVGSIPSSLSPRCPLAVRLISALTSYRLVRERTLRACHEALARIEIAIHPVRALPPVEIGLRRRRAEAIRDGFLSDHVVADAIIEDIKETVQFKMSVNLDALQPNEPAVKKAVEETKERQELIEEVKEEEEAEPRREIISAPNLFNPQKRPEEDDDEPLPELIL